MHICFIPAILGNRSFEEIMSLLHVIAENLQTVRAQRRGCDIIKLQSFCLYKIQTKKTKRDTGKQKNSRSTSIVQLGASLRRKLAKLSFWDVEFDELRKTALQQGSQNGIHPVIKQNGLH